jgi:hypothetical protein
MQATLSRDTTSVTFDVIAEGGSPLLFFDVGKPNAQEQRSGRVDPRSSDFWSGLRNISVRGEMDRASAYSDAQTLAEDLIKPYGNGDPLQLDISELPQHGTFDVMPLQQACILQYPPGTKDVVIVDLSMPVVSDTLG